MWHSKGVIQTQLQFEFPKLYEVTTAMGEAPNPGDTDLRFSGGRNLQIWKDREDPLHRKYIH